MRFLLFLSFGLFISISSFAQDESLADLIVKTKKDTKIYRMIGGLCLLKYPI